MVIQNVVFDMDGTLLDTERIYREAWLYTLDKLGYPDAEEMYPKVVGVPTPEIKLLFLEKYGKDADFETFVKNRSAYFESVVEKAVPVKEGAEALLKHLKEQGIGIALGTSTIRPRAERNLVRARLLPYFDAIVTAELVEHGKPAPDTFLKACELLGGTPGNTAVVEDSYNGIRAAYNAGMMPIMIHDVLDPTEEIRGKMRVLCESLEEVGAFIDKINRNG